jgi:hypothetical protein
MDGERSVRVCIRANRSLARCEACSYDPFGHLVTNHAGRKSLTAAARILDPKLSDWNAVDISVLGRAVESVAGNVRTWMNKVIDHFDSMHVE